MGVPARAADAIDPLLQPRYLVSANAPSSGRRVGRIFSYLGLTVLWIVLFAVAMFATVVALPAAISSNGPLGESPAFHRSDTWIAFIVIPFIVAPIMGVVAYFLAIATVGMFLTSATLFARSLSPAYRHEQLSTTITSVHGEAVGGISTAFTGVALSLIPVRLTRWAKVALIIQFNGWILNGNMLVLGTIWGWLYLFTFGWMTWPVTGTGLAVCVVISVLLLAWLVAAAWRGRRGFPQVMPEKLRGTIYEDSWPNRPEAKKTPARRSPARPRPDGRHGTGP